MYDMKIVGGTVVDGTGADRYRADIGIKDGKIVEVRRRTNGDDQLSGEAAETIDATDRIVAPGFVDIHTHYDGQATWDNLLEPSSGHGVTTIVAGNCGVGFAPVRPGSEEWLIRLMEGVEDIPGTALTEGMTWGWETYPEYLDVIDRQQFAVDIGSQVAHGAVRAYAMGERGARNEPATPDDIAAMSRLVREAIEAAGRLASPPRGRSLIRPWTVNRCRGPSPKTRCSASGGRWLPAARPCSSWLLRALPARTSSRRKRNWSGCNAWAPRSSGPCRLR